MNTPSSGKAGEIQQEHQQAQILKAKGLFAYVLHFGLARFGAVVMIPYVLANPEVWKEPLRGGTLSARYLAHYYYLGWLLELTLVGILVEILIIGLIALRSGQTSAGKCFQGIVLRTVLHNLPLPLLLLTLVAEPLWIPAYVLLSLILMAVDFHLFRPSSSRFYRLKFSAYQTLSLKRGITWSVALFFWHWYVIGFLTPGFWLYGTTKISSTKANMHTFQTFVESYAGDGKGNFPDSLTALEQAARQSGQAYWKDFTNPCTSQIGKGFSYSQFDAFDQRQIDYGAAYAEFLGIRVQTKPDEPGELRPERAGQVIFQPLSPKHYRILGRDCKGRWIEDRGRMFALSNS